MSTLIKLAIFLAVLWCGWWQLLAHALESRMETLPQGITSPNKPVVNGFPFALHLQWANVTFASESGTAILPMAEIKAWPVPRGHVDLYAPQGFMLDSLRDNQHVHFMADRFDLDFTLPALWQPRANWAVNVKSVDIKSGETQLSGVGDISFPIEGAAANGGLSLTISGYDAFLTTLVGNNMLPQDKANIAKSIMDTMATAQGGPNTIVVPLSIRDDVVYLSIVRLFNLAELHAPADAPAPLPQKIHSGGSATDSHPAPMPQTAPVGSPSAP